MVKGSPPKPGRALANEFFGARPRCQPPSLFDCRQNGSATRPRLRNHSTCDADCSRLSVRGPSRRWSTERIMDEGRRDIVRLNIARYEAMLRTETDLVRADTLRNLLAEARSEAILL